MHKIDIGTNYNRRTVRFNIDELDPGTRSWDIAVSAKHYFQTI